MVFNNHSKIKDLHSFLSPSKYSWVKYDDDKLLNAFSNHLNIEMGTKLHALASDLISLKIKLPKTKNTLNMFVNDAIGFKMQSEQMLYYSNNCFGTCDAISFTNGVLRIHDLKTGVLKANMTQLDIYTSLFCLEYDVDPSSILITERIYQNNEIVEHSPSPNDVRSIIEKIIRFDNLLETYKNDIR